MSSLADNLKEEYLSWLRNKIKFKNLGDTIEITTPIMDRHNDYFQIYVIPFGGSNFRISDAGYVIGDLELDGIDVLQTPKRKEILQTILNRHGVLMSPTKEIYVECTLSNFAQKKHMLVQAMLTINDMFMTSRANVTNIFVEEVAEFFENHGVRYTPNIAFIGKTGFTHQFDFVIPKSKNEPERIIKSLNSVNKQITSLLLFSWDDAKEMRSRDSELIIFLNDSNKKFTDNTLNPFKEYDVTSIPWSKRQDYIPLLTA